MASPKTLKASNRLRLGAAVASNLALLVALVHSDLWGAFTGVGLAQVVRSVVTGAGGLTVIAVLNALFSPTMKARLVYWRWRDPLPGGRAFTVHGPADPRVDMAALRRLGAPASDSPADQNATWYRWFKNSEKDATIEAAHRESLFLRDCAALSFLAILVLGVGGLVVLHGWARPAYMGFLVVQYLVVSVAARNTGIRLVTNVLALKALQSPPPAESTAAAITSTSQPQIAAAASLLEPAALQMAPPASATAVDLQPAASRVEEPGVPR